MPVVFAAHGAPVLLDDPVWMVELVLGSAGGAERFAVRARLLSRELGRE